MTNLSRRERQIIDFLYQHGRAGVSEVMAGIPDPPSYSAVRAMLRTLEEKGHVRHIEDGRAYIYEPIVQKDAARAGALTHLLKTFFDGSAEKAVAALLDLKSQQLTTDELDRVSKLLDAARNEGR
jgi:predicted transcriptional regulator